MKLECWERWRLAVFPIMKYHSAMEDGDAHNPEEIAERLRKQAAEDRIRVTIHGHQEMVADDVPYEDIRTALLGCKVLENYPNHQRGPCCLVCGETGGGRHLHVVCTTTREAIIVITVYEPKPPRWVTPYRRGGKDGM